jgi:hypothetical protein
MFTLPLFYKLLIGFIPMSTSPFNTIKQKITCAVPNADYVQE